MHRRTVLGVAAAVLSVAGCTSEEELDERGTLEITIDGTPVDLTADRFQAEHAESSSMAFHLHEGDEYWYMEGDQRVTVAEAIDHLPHFEHTLENDAHAITVDGSDYWAADSGTTIRFAVDGDEVDPSAYELQDGDHLLIEITTES